MAFWANRGAPPIIKVLRVAGLGNPDFLIEIEAQAAIARTLSRFCKSFALPGAGEAFAKFHSPAGGRIGTIYLLSNCKRLEKTVGCRLPGRLLILATEHLI